MNKIPKIAVSFLLILSIILNPFASVFAIRASAAVQFIPFLLEFIKYAAEGFIIGTSAYYAGAAADEIIKATDSLERSQRNAVNAVSGGVGVYLNVGDSTSGEIITNPDGTTSFLRPYQVSAELGYGYDELSDEEKEFADFFVNYINTNDISVYGWGDTSSDSLGSVDITVEGYEKLKNEVTSAYNEYATKKLAEESRLQSFIDMSEAGLYPEYDFGFVGPTPNILFPSSVTHSYVEKDGFVHTIPYSSDSLVNGRFATAEIAKSYAKGLDGVNVTGSDTQGYFFTASYTGYGGGRYILYNGVAYYARSYSYTPGATGRSCNSILASVPEFINFVDVNGNTLASVYTGGSYAQGIYYNKTGEVPLDRPQVTNIYDSDFTTTTGGGTVEIPRTEAEEVISQAMELGLINPDSTLELNEDGTIAGADGMTIAKLQELIDMIASGNLQFENIQEYLDLITKLVASGNYTATEQKVILDNIEALNQASAKSLEEINAAVLAISQALTLEGELEDVETDFSYLDVEHTGLIEAETIVNTALPIVGQAKQLVTNVFNSVDESSDVPNFNFYWDSNKDGEVEKYNFFDLSFMEQPLTNANLEDKSRFTDVMTVREFIQYIIIFVVYAGYLIKLLRRIPGLLGGSEGMADDVNTINSNRG